MNDTPSSSSPPRRPLAGLGTTGALAVAWAAFPALLGFLLLANIDGAAQWLNAHGAIAPAIYALAFMIAAGLGLLPTYAQAVLGGWVFGFALGFPLALLGFTGGSIIGYFVTRLVSRDRVQNAIAHHPRAAVIRKALLGGSFLKTLGLITLVRVPPNSPFSLTNLALAGAGTPLRLYTLGTLLGMAPRTAIVTGFAAAAAATGSADLQGFVRERGTLTLIIGVVVLIAVLAILSAVANSALRRAGMS